MADIPMTRNPTWWVLLATLMVGCGGGGSGGQDALSDSDFSDQGPKCVSGQPCDDGRYCTIDDKCVAGVCAGGPARDCTHLDENCVKGRCDNDTSSCVPIVLKDGFDPGLGPEFDCATGPCSCDAGEPCLDEDYCNANGNCVQGSVFICSDLPPCEKDSDCGPHELNYCLGETYCHEWGFCDLLGPPVVCEDPNPEDCFDSVCVPLSGECVEMFKSCDDLDLCTVDHCDPSDSDGNPCQHEVEQCDDGDPCTADHCDTEVGCLHPALDCDDGNPSTEDVCDSESTEDNPCNNEPWPLGYPYSSCSGDDECFSGICLETGYGQLCAQLCLVWEDCPEFWQCALVTSVPDALFICIPEEQSHCDEKVPVPEVCNGIDDDCDGITDPEDSEGCTKFCQDVDDDEFCGQVWDCDVIVLEPCKFKCLCGPEDSYTGKMCGDCDDCDPNVNPGAAESCNEKDDNCDCKTDEEDAAGCSTYYKDEDKDGWGTDDNKCLCEPVDDYTAWESGDCDDQKANVNPGAIEACNSIDDDCNGQTDEGCPPEAP